MALKHTTDARDCAAGYAHTYFDTKGIDLARLSTFPTNPDIKEASQQAWGEAESLWNYLGVAPDDVLRCPNSTITAQVPKLPGISSWFALGQDPIADMSIGKNQADVVLITPDLKLSSLPSGPKDDDEMSDSDSDISEYESEPEVVTEATELQALFDAEEVAPLRSTAVDDRMMALRCAAVSLSLDDISDVQTIEDLDDGEQELHAEEDRINLEETLSEARSLMAATIELPALKLAPEASAPYENVFAHGTFDTSQLVALRQAHETECAKKGVRTMQGIQQQTLKTETAEDSSNGQQPELKEAACRAIMREMAAILREQQDSIGTTTGLNRTVRITAKATGNLANAELATGQKAAAVVRRRDKAFRDHKVPHAARLSDALIGQPNKVQPDRGLLAAGNYGVVLEGERVLIARVITVYSRTAGKGVAHAYQPNVANIGQLSYLTVQVYKPQHWNLIRAILRSMAHLQVFRFSHVPSSNFFVRLPEGSCQPSGDGRSLEVQVAVRSIVDDLQHALPKLVAALKQLKARRRKGQAATDTNAGSDGDDDAE
ncbi:hypothetical protein C8Q72DRAFT_910638 [Fomitopsis betulina]|nr:hypothetical protein C8Q72DRAFT_910638 [Fomitopsis betulina]